MLNVQSKSLLAALGILCVLTSSKNAYSVNETYATFLLLSPSTRANGMGESLVAVADPSLTHFNPAALGLFTLGNIGAMGWSHADWFPGLDLDVSLEQFYANLGFDYRKLKPESTFDFALGLQYRNHSMDYGETEARDENNMPLGTFHSWERNRAIVVALGLEYGFQVGLGFSVGSVYSHMQSSARAQTCDLGMMLKLPIFNMLDKFQIADLQDRGRVSLEVTPSFGFARLSNGDGLTYDSPPGGGAVSSTDLLSKPFPTRNSYGMAIEFQVNYDSITIFQSLWANSKTHHLEEKDYVGDPYEEKGWGVEFAFFDLFMIRQGHYSTNAGGTDRDTGGYTIQTDGLTKLLYERHLKKQYDSDSVIGYLLTHASLKYHQSKWSKSNIYIDQTTWYELNITF